MELDETTLAALEYFSDHGKTEYPVWRAPDGAMYCLGGVWSSGRREYEYQHIEVAGAEARMSPYAEELGHWAGRDAGEVYSGCDPDYDGTGYQSSGKHSAVVLYRVFPGAPVYVKRGQTYRSSSGNCSGRKGAVYHNCDPSTYHGYLRATRGWLAAHAEATAAK